MSAIDSISDFESSLKQFGLEIDTATAKIQKAIYEHERYQRTKFTGVGTTLELEDLLQQLEMGASTSL